MTENGGEHRRPGETHRVAHGDGRRATTRSRRSLVRLYPREWRERYAREFEALLEQVQITLPLVADVIRAEMAAHDWSHSAR